jgi:pimeloyl-ACP methyl ester carboxylesterase
VVLVTGGAWGVGTLACTVASLLELSERVQVVAVCGRNQALRQRLEALGESRSRLVPLGFVDIMPELMASADVVVTNAGGVTSLEAFASARPVLLVDPIAGHGRANAAMMEQARLALVCHGIPELQSTVAELVADEERVARMRAAELAHLEGRDLGDDLALLAAAEPLPLPPGMLRVVAAAATENRVPLTFFVEGQDVAADRVDLARLARQGFEVEALRREVRLAPAYVAEPCGRFSLLAVAVTSGLHVRRVVFGQRLPVSKRAFEPPSMVPGGIIELLVTSTASPLDAAQAMHAVAAALRWQGLRTLTLAQMDRPDRHRLRTAA